MKRKLQGKARQEADGRPTGLVLMTKYDALDTLQWHICRSDRFGNFWELSIDFILSIKSKVLQNQLLVVAASFGFR